MMTMIVAMTMIRMDGWMMDDDDDDDDDNDHDMIMIT